MSIGPTHNSYWSLVWFYRRWTAAVVIERDTLPVSLFAQFKEPTSSVFVKANRNATHLNGLTIHQHTRQRQQHHCVDQAARARPKWQEKPEQLAHQEDCPVRCVAIDILTGQSLLSRSYMCYTPEGCTPMDKAPRLHQRRLRLEAFGAFETNNRFNIVLIREELV